MEATPGAAGASKTKAAETGDGSPEAGAATATATTTTTNHHVEVEDVSDPDEDDLDDLDDMLDDFSAAKIDTKPAGPLPNTAGGVPSTKPASRPGGPDDAATLDDEFNEEEFAKQLQEGMAGLLGELENSPEMQRQFEDMFKQMSEAVDAEEHAQGASPSPSGPSFGSPSSPPSKTAKPPQPDAAAAAAAASTDEDPSFQATIRRTMERMQSSGDQATAAAAAGGSDDFMAELLKQMASGDFGGGGGEGSEEDFSKMLMGMMEQLTNKEILYEPMKELHDKFPEWLAKNQGSTAAEDLKRYQEQQRIVAEIVAKFEEASYADSNAADREFIVDRMQKMQAAGSPPSDLVGDMASAQEAFNSADEQCNPQ